MESIRDVLRLARFHWRRIIWPLKRPPLPSNSDGRVYIHIGCGPLSDTRFINIDIHPFKTVHFLSGGGHLPFSSDIASVIYSSHVLEHFSHRQTESILSEWYRVLKNDGILYVAVPDFDKLIRLYRESGNDVAQIQPFLMGSQGNSFDFHKSVFTRIRLFSILENVGFKNCVEWDETDCAQYPFDDYAHYGPTKAFSLNMKATK